MNRGYGVLSGIAAGIAGGLFGVGGGIILVPILAGPFRLTQHQAHGTSLAIVGAAATVSLIVYALHGNVAWTTALVVAIASVFGARLGARLAARTPARHLAGAFAVLLVFLAIRLLMVAGPGGVHLQPLAISSVVIELGTGVAVGVLAGYFGVGGGVIAVPAFTLLLGMNQQLAQGTSLAVILVTAPAGAFEHHRHGNVVLRLIPPFAAGAVLGGPLASLLAQHLPARQLTRAFAVFLLANAIHIWIRASRRPADPAPSAA